MITARIIADSISPNGNRLTTFQCRYPRIILAEVNTHKMISKSTSSSRAIPVEKMIKQVTDDPFIPISWGKNQKGMQAGEELSKLTRDTCEAVWLAARDKAVNHATDLIALGLHKQIANRLLEPWMWTESIFTATDWANFYALRDSEFAEPHMQALAKAMLAAHKASEPVKLAVGGWHLPYVFGGNNDRKQVEPVLDDASLLKLSVARCARVSYLNHDGTHPDPVKDIALHDSLLANGHMSPFEHQATPSAREEFSGNLFGWIQYRKMLPKENRSHPDMRR